ncbi:MAG: hypothetical protein K2W82_04800 [Candidatus Obscuribacterales bacterium]|nr:hypothetical protein [Candidatus Obscuribacterales bacterium]
MKSEPDLTTSDLDALPQQAQLLVAHLLEENNNDLTLLNQDTDASRLISLGWLTEIPLITIGVVSFKIKSNFWRQLKALQSKFLTKELLAELKIYRQQKTALYPWVW